MDDLFRFSIIFRVSCQVVHWRWNNKCSRSKSSFTKVIMTPHEYAPSIQVKQSGYRHDGFLNVRKEKEWSTSLLAVVQTPIRNVHRNCFVLFSKQKWTNGGCCFSSFRQISTTFFLTVDQRSHSTLFFCVLSLIIHPRLVSIGFLPGTEVTTKLNEREGSYPIWLLKVERAPRSF